MIINTTEDQLGSVQVLHHHLKGGGLLGFDDDANAVWGRAQNQSADAINEQDSIKSTGHEDRSVNLFFIPKIRFTDVASPLPASLWVALTMLRLTKPADVILEYSLICP
jgi:hypothetical protein